MKCNVGGAERTGRIIIGGILLVIGGLFLLDLALRIILVALGVIALATGLLRFCPVSALLGRDTCKQVEHKPK